MNAVATFFVDNKKEVFNVMGLGADWMLLAPLGEEARGTAQKVSDFAANTVDVFAWPNLISDTHRFVVAVASQAEEGIRHLFLSIVKLGGSLCDTLLTLQTHLKVAEWGKAFFWLKNGSYGLGFIEDCHDLGVEIFSENSNLHKFIFTLKVVSSVAFTIFALYALWTGTALSPYFSLVAYTIFQASKMALHYYDSILQA